jgi:hypothetical protein
VFVKKNLLIGVLVVGFALVLTENYLLTGAARDNATSTTTQFDTLTSTATQFQTVTATVMRSVSSTSSLQPNASNALDLSVSIEPAASPQGLNLTVVASVINPTSSNLTFNSHAIYNPARGPCAEPIVTSVNVYMGHLGQGNFSGSKPLALFNPYAAYSCPTYTQSVFNYVFGPGQAINETSLLYGYWSGSGTSYTNYNFRTFQVGDYTIVISDAWGQRAFEYFAVIS